MDGDLAGCGNGNRLAAEVVGEHPAGAFGKHPLLGCAQTDAFETKRLPDKRNHDAVRTQTETPGVHLNLPAAIDRNAN